MFELFGKFNLAPDLTNDTQTVVNWGKKWLDNLISSKAIVLPVKYMRDPSLSSINMIDDNIQESDSLPLIGITLSG